MSFGHLSRLEDKCIVDILMPSGNLDQLLEKDFASCDLWVGGVRVRSSNLESGDELVSCCANPKGWKQGAKC